MVRVARALSASRTPEQKVTALQKLGRTFERQGRYEEARSLFLKGLRLRADHPELDQSTTARTHLFLRLAGLSPGQVRQRQGALRQGARDRTRQAR